MWYERNALLRALQAFNKARLASVNPKFRDLPEVRGAARTGKVNTEGRLPGRLPTAARHEPVVISLRR